MSRRSILIGIGTAFLAAGAFAQITVGRLYADGNSGSIGSPSQVPYSFVDVMHPATGAGSLTRAVVRWTGAPSTPCASAFKLKFLRPTSVVANYSAVIERGPFPASNGRNEVTLSPAVTVQAGDLIGVTQLQNASTCGSVQHTVTNDVVSLAGNLEVSTGANGLGFITGFIPRIYASSDASSLVAVLVVAGAAPGSNGAFFRTSVQMTGSDFTPITGRLVYHPAGVPASPSDPSTSFTIADLQTISFADIATSLGQVGLGSIDIFTSGVPPAASARIFNDTGATGTSGFTEEAISPYEALQGFEVASLHMPSDVTNFRMNVGVRTLGAPVTMSVGRWSSSGGFLAGTNITRTYPANYFEQTTAQAFAGLTSLAADGLLTIQVNAGQAIIYATITDNRTNDSSMQIAVPRR
jgi:hypothetical protein